ncbi:unnamed protein product [Effrenium voratum]|uniref:Cytochrome b5 heme-binding domain-containing protein n=1 Tax=Effrenium voratum TaxID=2562239 RepID=A0AA36I952_9DINO|nr:unnamed protein product [Effrenium voratum]CAJ1439457.1 unnamed protein product [Effrenium voratum]
MAFLLPLCRCSQAVAEAALEDADEKDIQQDGDAKLGLPHFEELSVPAAPSKVAPEVEEQAASEHSTATPSGSQEAAPEVADTQLASQAPAPQEKQEAKAEAKPTQPKPAQKAPKRPPEPLTGLDEQNFNDRGVSTLDESKKFTYTIGNEYKCELKGWTHTRPYAFGFVRNKPGTARAVVSGLDPEVAYFWKVYQVANLYGSANSLSVNGEDQGKTTASKSKEATASGKAVADKAGKITFTFTREGDEVHLSGLAVGREEEKEGKPKPKAKAKVKAKAKKSGKKDEEKYDELGRRIDRLPQNKKTVFDSSSDEDFDDNCPSSKKNADFERELKRMKKQVRAGMSAQQREEMENPWLHTQVSDQERQLKKNMFKSFYQEQYARLKAKAGPDLEQYDKKDPTTGETLAPNLKAEGGHRPMPRPRGVKPPSDFRKDVGRISGKDLREKHGCEGPRMLISVYGDIFDVSDRPDKYGPDGPYWYMTGKDITWALVSGEDSEENMDKFYDLFKIQPAEAADRRLQGLMSWWAFYEKEYGQPVGRNTAYDKEWGLPAPPHVEAACSVM